MKDYFQKFRDIGRIDQQDLPVHRRVEILWADPYGHFDHLSFHLDKLGFPTFGYRQATPGIEFEIVKGVTLFYSGQNPDLIPKREFDLCLISRTHGGTSDLRTAVAGELFPYSQKAEFTVYRDCCHGEAAEMARQLGGSHPVSTQISYELLAEMVVDLLRGETDYIDFGTDFKKAEELAETRNHSRKKDLYIAFEKDKLK